MKQILYLTFKKCFLRYRNFVSMRAMINCNQYAVHLAVADPGFNIGGGANLVKGVGEQLPMWLHYKKVVCQNGRIETPRGHVPGAPPWIQRLNRIHLYLELK